MCSAVSLSWHMLLSSSCIQQLMSSCPRPGKHSVWHCSHLYYWFLSVQNHTRPHLIMTSFSLQFEPETWPLCSLSHLHLLWRWKSWVEIVYLCHPLNYALSEQASDGLSEVNACVFHLRILRTRGGWGCWQHHTGQQAAYKWLGRPWSFLLGFRVLTRPVIPSVLKANLRSLGAKDRVPESALFFSSQPRDLGTRFWRPDT